MDIRGEWTDLFSHCVAIGLASILQNEGKRVKLHWPDRHHIRVETDDEMSEEKIATVVISSIQKFKKHVSSKESDADSGVDLALLNPHIANEKTWDGYNAERAINLDRIDKFFQKEVVYIGRPSYWSAKRNDGASCWIMFSKQSGRYFFETYCSGICKECKAAYPISESGNSSIDLNSAARRLAGEECIREGKLSDLTYRQHGLCETGRKIDTLQFWCALHAFGCFSTRPIVPGRADIQSPSNCLGFFKHGGKEYFCLPVFNKPVYFERFKSVLRSADLYTLCKKRLDNPKFKVSDGMNRLGIQSAYIFERLENTAMKKNKLHYAVAGTRVCDDQNERG